MKSTPPAFSRESVEGKDSQDSVDSWAGIARQGDLRQCGADPYNIANADFLFTKALNGQVFAETAKWQIVPMYGFPPCIMAGRIHADRAVSASVKKVVGYVVALKSG
ncbi:MAG: hypothetical protein ABSF43_04810 [Rectinemataceae bacterium]